MHYCRQKISLKTFLTLKLLVWVFFSFLLDPSAFADTYRLKAVVKSADEGTRFQLPWTWHWQALRAGLVLPPDTLLQVEDGSKVSITLHYLTAKNKKAKPSIEVEIPGNSTIRISENIVRDADVRMMFIDTLTNELNIELDEELKMQDSWDKVAAMLNKPLGALSRIFKGDKKDEKTIGTEKKTEKIVLLRPTPEHEIKGFVLPLKFQVIWRPVVDKRVRYGVRVWKNGALRPRPQFFTVESNQNILLTEHGEFFVQVVSEDGLYESGMHKITVIKPLSEDLMAYLRKPLGQARARGSEVVPLSPSSGFSYYSGNEQQRVHFSWKLRHDVMSRVSFKLQLMRGTEELINITTDSNFYSETLIPGDYRWKVSLVGEKGVESDWISFSLKQRRETDGGLVFSGIGQHLRSQSRKVQKIYFDSGF